MPSRLTRYQQTRNMHYITFTCYHRHPKLMRAEAKALFEQTLERARRWYGFWVSAYVVMPEHIHLLVKRAGAREAFHRLADAETDRLPETECRRARTVLATSLL